VRRERRVAVITIIRKVVWLMEGGDVHSVDVELDQDDAADPVMWECASEDEAERLITILLALRWQDTQRGRTLKRQYE
jgi:hypothetical protein